MKTQSSLLIAAGLGLLSAQEKYVAGLEEDCHRHSASCPMSASPVHQPPAPVRESSSVPIRDNNSFSSGENISIIELDEFMISSQYTEASNHDVGLDPK